MPRWLLAITLAVAIGCGGKTADAPHGGDVEDYTRQLKSKVPFEIAKFKASGYKAEEYDPHEEYPDYFRSLTIKIDPVRLSDKITGRTERYTRARLTLNRPTPTRVPIRGPGRMGDPPEWARVEMLP